ncbi:transposase [Streptomyces sp. NBC_01231]|nr:transposase [Streptomyces sp. NBC_01231]
MQIGATLANAATTAGVKFRAVVADCAYGDHNTFRAELSDARLPFVMALKRGHGAWQYKDAFRPVDAARELAWYGPEQSGDWQPVTRTFRNGRTTTWWAADARLGWWGPDGVIRLVVATTDPATLPETSTWYLATNLPRPGSPARHTAATRPPISPKWYGSTACGTGSSRATNKSRTNSAGPTSRSAPTPRSAATRPS